eukprot:scaffold55058_cov20-Prasinocladus_malaysianus.AAC.1
MAKHHGGIRTAGGPQPASPGVLPPATATTAHRWGRHGPSPGLIATDPPQRGLPAPDLWRPRTTAPLSAPQGVWQLATSLAHRHQDQSDCLSLLLV